MITVRTATLTTICKVAGVPSNMPEDYITVTTSYAYAPISQSKCCGRLPHADRQIVNDAAKLSIVTATPMKPTVLNLYVDDCGTTAVEFAIVSPVFLGMVIGILGLGLFLFVIGGMHYAVEEARCASVKTTVCTDSTSPIAYVQSHYVAPGCPTFTYQPNAARGKSVSASLRLHGVA